MLLLTVFRILFHPYAIVIFHGLLRLLVNVFADLIIYNAESTQLVYNSGQKLPICSDLVLSIAPGVFSVEECSQAARNQYCPRSILVSPPPAWLHSTRAIRSFIALIERAT